MEILYLLIPLSLVFVAVIAGFFMWAVKSGQFEDMEGPAHRILMDEDLPEGENRGEQQKSEVSIR
ncbi:MAG: cbb3-type cytochrome oxidase assembly protein CcoS [Thiobacillaceae bacterium]